MKKYIVSFLMIGTFGLYVLYQKTGSSSVADAASKAQQVIPIDTTLQNAAPTGKTGGSKNIVTPPPTTGKSGQYKDGTYTGMSADAYYGNVQVAAVIQNGKLADVKFLDYPRDRNRSIEINTRALPYLKSEAIQAQSANVSTVSGATDSSGAFMQSLDSALTQATK